MLNSRGVLFFFFLLPPIGAILSKIQRGWEGYVKGHAGGVTTEVLCRKKILETTQTQFPCFTTSTPYHLEALMDPVLPWRECHLSATVGTSRWAEVKCLSLYMILLAKRTTGVGSETANADIYATAKVENTLRTQNPEFSGY